MQHWRLTWYTPHRRTTTESDSLGFSVNDNGNSPAPAQIATGTAAITVAAVNDAPTATNLIQSFTVAQGSGALNLTDIVVTDPDTGDTITATLTLNNAASGASF